MATGRVPTTANSPLTAKGDLFTYSTAPARLAVGNNGESLVADSSTSTGLRWQGDYAAGKNKIINGDFNIWQRGTSSGSAGYQTADRWYENASNSTTFARESTTVPTGATYSFKMTAGATAQMWIQQAIETLNANSLAGQNVTASAYVSASTNTLINIVLFYSTATDNPASGSWTGISPTSGGQATATSSGFTRLTGVWAIPSTAKTVMMQVTTTSTVASGVIVYIGNCQLELGSVATAFQTATGTIQGELAACQRYYEKSYNTDVAPATTTDAGVIWMFQDGSTSTLVQGQIFYKITKRGTPTLTIYSPVGGATGVVYNNKTGANVTATALGNGASNGTFYTNIGTAGTGYAGKFHYVAELEL